MAQQTAFGEAELTTYMKVDRVNGTVAYYKVYDGQTVPITEAEYVEGTS